MEHCVIIVVVTVIVEETSGDGGPVTVPWPPVGRELLSTGPFVDGVIGVELLVKGGGGRVDSPEPDEDEFPP